MTENEPEFNPGIATEDRSPSLERESFTCPTCDVYALQPQRALFMQAGGGWRQVPKWMVTMCAACHDYALWRDTTLAWPPARIGPTPNPEMPDDVRELYEEAREVGARSPRSAGGLLRLALQLLVDQLEEGDGNINTKIGALVKRGLAPEVQAAMDTVRVIGNNAMHPGEIDLRTDRHWIPSLFALVNLITEQMISRPKRVAEMYAALPAGAQAAIERRDAKEA